MKKGNIISRNSLLVSLLTLCVLSTNAQEEKSRTRYSGGFGHFSASYETYNIAEFNTALLTAGYGKAPESSVSFGGAGYFVIKNVLIGGGGASLMGYSNSTDSTVMEVSGGYGFASAGYVFSTGKRSFFYPNVGVGAGGFTAQLGKAGASPNFSEQLSAPRGRFHTGAGGYFFNFQLAWQTMIGTGSKQGWSVGIKAGYRLAPQEWSMDVNGDRGFNSPGINLNGLSLTLTLGGGALGGDN